MPEPSNSPIDPSNEIPPSAESSGLTPKEFTRLLSAAEEIPSPHEPTDARALKEEAYFEKSRNAEELLGITQDRKQRKKFAKRIFALILGWLISIFILLLLDGFLSEGVKFSGSFFGKDFVK